MTGVAIRRRPAKEASPGVVSGVADAMTGRDAGTTEAMRETNERRESRPGLDVGSSCFT
jgi:hypothetical protein